MMQSTAALRKVIITGGNKGIGYEIAKHLYSDQSANYQIILTARNTELGEDAKRQIIESVSETQSNIEVKQLEVNDEKSVSAFVEWVKNTLKDVDVLINNAGYFHKKPDPEGLMLTLSTNFFSVVNLTEKILPSLTDDGKIIQISSGMGKLHVQGTEIKDKLSNPVLTREELLKIANELYEKTRELKQVEAGWNENSYSNSKCLLNAYTRWVLPGMLKEQQQCYCCTPGYCRTDMTSPEATLSAEEGARTPVFLVKLPFVRDETYHTKFIRTNQSESYD